MVIAVSRRKLLSGAAALLACSARGATEGLIIRQKEPENLEYPFTSLSGFVIPNDQFYVRSHFAVPKLDQAAWKLRVEGAVDHPFEINYSELVNMPSERLMGSADYGRTVGIRCGKQC